MVLTFILQISTWVAFPSQFLPPYRGLYEERRKKLLLSTLSYDVTIFYHKT